MSMEHYISRLKSPKQVCPETYQMPLITLPVIYVYIEGIMMLDRILIIILKTINKMLQHTIQSK